MAFWWLEMARGSHEERAFRETAIRMREVSLADSMNITAQLIDDIVLTFWASLKRNYPSVSFQELIRKGHQELFIHERRITQLKDFRSRLAEMQLKKKEIEPKK